MGTTSYELIYRRLDELFEQSLELADAADAEMLVYLVEMAKLELRTLRVGEDNARSAPLVKITQHK
jgi:hypothetical protein